MELRASPTTEWCKIVKSRATVTAESPCGDHSDERLKSSRSACVPTHCEWRSSITESYAAKSPDSPVSRSASRVFCGAWGIRSRTPRQ